MEASENAQNSQPGDQSQQSHQLPPDANEALYKNQLQGYALRAGLGYPVYYTKNTGQPHLPQFKCSVTVGDETYESLTTFSQKKAAEQDAAKHALKCIFAKRQETGLSIISKFKDTKLCKAVLNEFAAKLQVEKPKYGTVQALVDLQDIQVSIPVFVSTLEVRGVSYTGRPAKTKKEAEQLVAHDVIMSLLGNQEEDSTLVEILLSKAKLISALESSLDPSRAARLVEGSNSASGDSTTAPTQQDPTHDAVMLTNNEEQFKEASKSPALHIEAQNPSTPPRQTLTNESGKVTSPSPADESLAVVPCSSQNPMNAPLQTLANVAYNATPPQAHEPVALVRSSSQNPVNLLPLRMLSNEAHNHTSAPQALEPVSVVPPSSQNPVNPLPLRMLSNEAYSHTSAPQALEPVSPVPPSSQNLVATQMHNSANQSFESRHGQVVSFGFCAPPQHLTAPPPPPQVAPTAVGPNQDICVSCASQLAKRMNRNQKRKARKKARLATE